MKIKKPVRTRVSVFAAPGLAGTRASVWLMARPIAPSEQARLASDNGNEACCFTWPDGEDYQVRCYNNGVPIRFCGHGLLACAAAWQRFQALPRRLCTETTDYRINEDGDGALWLHAPGVHCVPAPAPEASWFNIAPVTAAIAGDENGYWILRWPDSFDLKGLQANFAAICRSTDRALIATCRAEPGSEYDVGLRYFAPQYGNNEDSATGSAAVVLADYWQQPELVLRQFSARGGLINARILDNRVAISGNMAIG